MRLAEAAQFLRQHAVAFPISEEGAALLAIALASLACLRDGYPELVPNLKRGVCHFLDHESA